MIIKKALIYFLIISSVIYIYYDVSQFEFINFDDYPYVLENPYVNTGVSLANIEWAFSKFHVANWHPLTWVSHMIDVEIYGLNAGGHHVSNVIIHIINSVLLLYLLDILTKQFWPSVLVSILFAVHPAHVESVVWIAERKDVLSAFFFILTLISYKFYVDSHSKKLYFFTLFLYICGLLSKPMLVTLPFVLLLLDIWPLRRLNVIVDGSFKIGMVLILEKIPFLALSIVISTITYIAQKNGGAMTTFDSSELNIHDRIINAILSYGKYIIKLFAPMDLTLFHVYKKTWSGWLDYNVLLSLGALLALFYVSIRNHLRFPYLFFGFSFFLGTLVPVIGIVQVGLQSMADRYTYIPYIGLFIMISWYLNYIYQYTGRVRNVFVISILFIISLYIIQAKNYVSFWRNDLTVMTRILFINDVGYNGFNGVVNNPSRDINASLSPFYTAVGLELIKRNQLDAAESHLKVALDLNRHGNKFESYYGLAVIYRLQNKFDDAVYMLDQAIKEKPTKSIKLKREIDEIMSDLIFNLDNKNNLRVLIN